MAAVKDNLYIQEDVSGMFTTLLLINSKIKLETTGKQLRNIRQGTPGSC